MVIFNCNRKRLNHEVFTLSDDDTELAIIRRKKMAKLMAREKKMQEQKEQKEKTDVERTKLLQRFLTPDAQSYLSALMKNEPQIGKRVEDVILYLIVYRGLRQTITQLDIRYVERQVKGEGPKIRVQRDGEMSDFGSYVKDAIKESSNDSNKD
ncbi:MAG: DNA-binding protein [Candidatus Thorarchaeota archaeon]